VKDIDGKPRFNCLHIDSKNPLEEKKCSCPEYSKNLLNNVCEYCGHLAVFHAKRLSSETKSIPIAKTRKLWKVDLPQQTSSGASEPPPSTAAKPNEEKRKRDKFIAGFNVPTILLNDQKVTAASMFAKAIRQLNRWSEANILSTSFYDLLSNAMMEWEEECPEHDGAKKHEFRANRILHLDRSTRCGGTVAAFDSQAPRTFAVCAIAKALMKSRR
jgi:hypothetical protein